MKEHIRLYRRIAWLLIAALALCMPMGLAELTALDSGRTVRISGATSVPTGIYFYVNLIDSNNRSMGEVSDLFQSDPTCVEAYTSNKNLTVDAVVPLSDLGIGTHYYICVDSSGSMATTSQVQEALTTFVLGMNAGNRARNNVCSIWTFGTEITQLETRTNDTEKLKAAIQKIKHNENNTHMYECIWKVVDEADRNKEGNVVIILITDGVDDQSDIVKRSGSPDYTFDMIRDTVHDSGVPIYGIMVPAKAGMGTQNTTELQTLCSESNGDFTSFSTVDDSKGIYDVIRRVKEIEDNTSAVHVQLYNDGTLPKSGAKFGINVQKDGKWIQSREFSVRYDSSIWPTPSPTPEPTPSPTPTPAPTREPRVIDTIPPTATPTPTITPSPRPTFPPTEPPVTPTPEPTPEPGTMDKLSAWFHDHFTGDGLRQNWWMLAAALVLLIGLVILIVVLVTSGRKRRAMNDRIAPTNGPGATNTDSRGTIRSDQAGGYGGSGTRRSMTNLDTGINQGGAPMTGIRPTTGTTRVDGADVFSTHVPPTNATGMVRMTDPGVGVTGTVRMTGESLGKEIRIEERRDAQGFQKEHTLYLNKELNIGRVPPNDLVVDDKYASSRHLRISQETDGLYVADLNSANGTRVNGEKLTGIQPLRSGDVITIGTTTLKVTF